jgi:signal transduction histidine kinase
MTKEQTDHIFERYWQAGATASSGTGLGLAISKAIVDAHDGTISVRSEVGKGSTFFVSLPLASKVQSSAA